MKRIWTFLRKHYKNVQGKGWLLSFSVKLTLYFPVRVTYFFSSLILVQFWVQNTEMLGERSVTFEPCIWSFLLLVELMPFIISNLAYMAFFSQGCFLTTRSHGNKAIST